MKKKRYNFRCPALFMTTAMIVVFASCEKPEDDPANGINKPAAVEHFTAMAGNTQVVLDWEAPAEDGGSPITGYEVTMDNWANKVAKTANEQTHTYPALTNGTEYTFKVRALNDNGAGAENTAIATPKAVSSGPLGDWTLPVNLKVTYKSNNVVGEALEDSQLSTIIKIGNGYYGKNDGKGQWDYMIELYLKNTSTISPLWNYYRKYPDTAWELVAQSFGNPEYGQLVYDANIPNILDYMYSGRATVADRPVVGTDVILGRPVEVRTSSVGSRYYIDTEHNVVLKIVNVNQLKTIFEVKSWDETVTSFTGINLPE